VASSRRFSWSPPLSTTPPPLPASFTPQSRTRNTSWKTPATAAPCFPTAAATSAPPFSTFPAMIIIRIIVRMIILILIIIQIIIIIIIIIIVVVIIIIIIIIQIIVTATLGSGPQLLLEGR